MSYLSPPAGNVETAAVLEGGVTVHQQVMAIGDGINAFRVAAVTAGLQLKTAGPSWLTTPLAEPLGLFAGIGPAGTLRVSPEPTSLFYDVFDGVLDANKWATSGSVVPTVSGGDVTINAGVGASASSRLLSVPAFGSAGAGFIIFGMQIQFEAAPVANVYRFWGTGTLAGSPAYQGAAAATSLALANAVGFELDTAGNLYAVVYSNSAMLYRQSIATKPTDGLDHRYVVAKRGGSFVFYLDNFDAPVATANFVSPAVQTLPATFAAFNNSTAPAAYTFKMAGMSVSDSSAGNLTVSDATYPWRKALVSAGGALAVADLAHTNVDVVFTSAAAAVADTLLTLPLNKGGTTSSVTTIPVTAGKILRITSITLGLRTTTAAVPFGKALVRVNYSGAAVIGSPAVLSIPVAGTAAVAGTGVTVIVNAPNGLLDLTGTAQFGISFSNNVNTNVTDISVSGYEFAA